MRASDRDEGNGLFLGTGKTDPDPIRQSVNRHRHRAITSRGYLSKLLRTP